MRVYHRHCYLGAIVSTFAGLALALWWLQRHEHFVAGGGAAAIAKLNREIRSDNKLYAVLAQQEVREADGSVRIAMLPLAKETETYARVKKKVRGHVDTWKKIMLYTNATLDSYKNANDDAQKKMVTRYESDGYPDL